MRLGVELDRKNPDQYLVSLDVGGLGLPDKDYYLNPDARFVAIREAYVEHIQRMLGFAGVTDGKARAEQVLALETALAKPQWERAKRRDRDKTYNVSTFAQFQKQFPGYDWTAHLRAQEMPQPDRVNVVTPDAVQPVLDVIAATPLPVWRDYLAFHAIDGNADLLSRAIDDASFQFNGKVLGGQKAQRDDWKRAVAMVGAKEGLGDAVGEMYVARYFKPESKVAMDKLVENLRAALRQNIQQLDWMGEATKAEAYHKLETFRPKIGYPDKWTDYQQRRHRAERPGRQCRSTMRRFNRADQNRRVGQKTDRDEWRMTPQTVNAYYNSTFNEIVFPAAILQPPFFDVNADPAVNYGGIGAVIGHEMGHGFDDQGSKSDFAGIQRNWWTDADRAHFDQRTKALGAQYDAYCPLRRPVRQRRADDGREHRRPRRHLDGLHRLPPEPERQAGAGDRRPDRRPALLPRVRPDLEGQVPRRVAADADQDQPALAGHVPRQRPGAQLRPVVQGVRREARRRAVPRAGKARAHLVTNMSGD